MAIKFDKTNNSENKIEKILKEEKQKQIALDLEERKIEQLSNAVNMLVGKASFVQNIKITNKKAERKKFKKARKGKNTFSPDFKFRNYSYNPDNFLKLVKELKKESKTINSNDIEKYDFQHLTSEDFSTFFNEIFEEIKLYVDLASNIEDRETWKNKSLDIWPMVDKKTVKNTRNKIDELKNHKKTSEQDKNLPAEKVKEMWEKELQRLNITYNVEIRNVNGCFNIPEESTVVVAKGNETERLYSKKEAKILTMHELFHVVRAYNGFKAGEQNNFPPILGLHTPFYDKTEEGGAIYREHKTGVITPEKEFDYHLRLLAAYYHYEGWHFQDIAEKLIELGGSVDRSFYLAARNREALRHHIYQGGYYEEWKNNEELWPLLIGKLNPKYAELFKKEVKKGNMEMPRVGTADLFEYDFD